MPYKLCITPDDIREELLKMGINDMPDEVVDQLRKDLLKLIKRDLKNLKREKYRSYNGETGYSDNNFDADKKYDERIRIEKELMATSTSTAESDSSELSDSATGWDLQGKSREKTEKSERASSGKSTVSSKEALPSYPEKVDPVTLYHFYKAYWDKFKAPGEDPRSSLRWAVREKLFYST